jgi:hypothetical protein
MAESRPVPNPELAVLGPKLEKPGRDKLNQLGLMDSQRIGGRFVHELTDRGWRVCRDILRDGPPPRSTGAVKAHYTFLAAFDRYLTRADLSLAEVFWSPEAEPNIEGRIRKGYAALATRPGAWLGLATLRDELTDMSTADLDTALRELYQSGAISLIPEENQKVLTPVDRAAAIEIGGQAKHLIAIDA